MINIKIVSLSENNCVLSTQSFAVNEGTILNALIQTNMTIHAPCGGNNKCHKCNVDILKNGIKYCVQSCTTKVEEGMTIYIKKDSELTEEYIENSYNSEYIMCLDLGTTTLVFYIVDTKTNNIVFTESIKNPQAIFGGDVISRIQYANTNGIKDLFIAINRATENELLKLKKYNVSRLYVCGNPTMLHLFYNHNVKSLGEYPYTPLFIDKKEFPGLNINLSVKDIILLPSFSSFIGSDLSAGVLQTYLTNGNNMLIDLGTNGEMILNFNNKIYATSTAAGPAFEGVGIECGCGAILGAINHVFLVDNKITYTTIGDKEPVGITGSALVDTISLLKDQNIIDSTGKLLIENKKYRISEKVYLTQKDIRSFQLAKSAIRTGLEILLDEANAKVTDINKVYIAGGFGHYLNIESAINVGLLPKELKDKYVNAGNTAGLGTVMYSLDKDNKYKSFLDNITKDAITVDLNSNKEFLDKYTDNMEI